MFQYILIISLTMALVSTAEKGKRLIKLDLSEPAIWMTDDEIEKAFTERKTNGFVDFTRIGVETLAKPAQTNKYKYPNVPRHQVLLRQLFSHFDKGRMEEHVKKLSGFHSRFAQVFYGRGQAEDWLKKEIKSILINYEGSSIRYIADSSLGTPNENFPYKQKNMIVKLTGKNPILAEEPVILGAHYDSANGYFPSQWTRGRAAPGADDNATGCAVLLEVLRLLAKFGIKFRHSIEFHFYTAKETGLQGSQDVVKEYNKEGIEVKGMLNLDSLGYPTRTGVWDIAGFVRDTARPDKRETDPALTAFVKMIVDEYLLVVYQVKEVNRKQGWFSDHYSWYLGGYPTAFVTEFRTNPDLHSERDKFGQIYFNLVKEFAKLGAAFVIELGELSEMPILPTPDTTTALAKNGGMGYSQMGVPFLSMYYVV